MYGYDVFHEDKLKMHINAARENRVQQAYIFAGEKGIGKRKAARLFAASLVCGNEKLAPCGSCSACIGAKADTNPDIKYIHTEDKKTIGVDTVREIVTDAYIRPFESRKKVYIIEEGDAVTEQAQNALLKILEEPPEYVVFIILVSNLSALLQTIISRCTIVRFTALKKDEIIKYAKENYPDADSEFLANYAEGNPGRVDEIMSRENFFLLRAMSLKMLIPLMSSHMISAYRIAEFAEENKEDAEQIVEFWQSMVRDIIFLQSNPQSTIINSDLREDLKELAGRFSPRVCLTAAETLRVSAEMIRRYVNIRANMLNLAFTIKKESQ